MPAPTPPHHHHRRSDGKGGCQTVHDLHLRRRRGATTASSSPAPRRRTADKAVILRGADRATGFAARPIPYGISAPSSSSVFIDDVRRPPERGGRDEDGGLVRSSPIKPERTWPRPSRPAWPGSRWRGSGVRQGAHGLQGTIAPPGHRRTARQSKDRDRARTTYDPAGRQRSTTRATTWRRRGGQHGEYAAAEAACDAADRAVQPMGARETQEYGMAGCWSPARGPDRASERGGSSTSVAMHSWGCQRATRADQRTGVVGPVRGGCTPCRSGRASSRA